MCRGIIISSNCTKTHWKSNSPRPPDVVKNLSLGVKQQSHNNSLKIKLALPLIIISSKEECTIKLYCFPKSHSFCHAPNPSFSTLSCVLSNSFLCFVVKVDWLMQNMLEIQIIEYNNNNQSQVRKIVLYLDKKLILQ